LPLAAKCQSVVWSGFALKGWNLSEELILKSKGESGVQGASFMALVGTLSVVSTVPVAGMALILGIDRFM